MKPSYRPIMAIFSLFFVFSAAVKAEPLSYFLPQNITYDPTVPTPETVLGHALGDAPARVDRIETYVRLLAATSPRLSLSVMGHSHEGRPLLLVTVTHPDNQSRLEAIRLTHQKQAHDGAPVQNPEPAGDNAAGINNLRALDNPHDSPTIVWMNYGVHGAETSGLEAVIPTLYYLAAAQGQDIEEKLRHMVILIASPLNPDGHNRRADWVGAYQGKRVQRDPNDEIHHQIWPGGRTNHYGFDLNRQWLLQTQPEAIAWLRSWHAWQPHVTTDFHEMGPESSYYFHPGVPSRIHPLIPQEGRALLVKLADFHRQSLDREGYLYFTEEGFDNFYVGKGSTYPLVNGGVGILFEAGGQMGLERASAQGVKSLARNVRTHFLTGLSTIEGSFAEGRALQDYQRRFFKESLEEALADKTTAYVFRAPEDPVREALFIQLLQRHQIDVYPLIAPMDTEAGRFNAGAYVVPLAQQQYRFIKSVMEKRTSFTNTVFYDVSGWTLPLAYGLDYGASRSSLKGKLGDRLALLSGPEQSQKLELVAGAALESELKAPRKSEGPAAQKAPKNRPENRPENTALKEERRDAAYAYALRWSDYYAPRALMRLFDAGLFVRLSLKPLRLQTRGEPVDLAAGSLIVPQDRQALNSVQLQALMDDIRQKDGVQITPVLSGTSLNIGSDLGGRDSFVDLTSIKPLLLVGAGVSVGEAGEIWHSLDARMNIPVTLVRSERFATVPLEKYSHLILPSASKSLLNDDLARRIKAWVRQGGVLIAQKNAALWAANLLTPAKEEGADSNDKRADAQADKTSHKNDAPPRLAYGDKESQDAENVIGGALFASDLDLTHPLGFGYERSLLASHKDTSYILPRPKDPYAQVAVYQEEPLLSGYASPRAQEEISGTAFLTAERLGMGSVILFADDPNFRASYLGTEKLFMNALFFGKAFKPAFGRQGEANAAEEALEDE